MQCVFDKCYDAVKCANENKGFGFYYSEKQNPDLSIHIHDCCEVLLCISGGKNFLINDKVYDVNDGDLFIINQFEAHKITFDPDKKFCRYVMQVHPEFLYSQSSAQTDLSHCFYTRGGDISHKLTLSQEERETLVGYIKRLEAEESYGDDIIKKITATQFLILINSAFVSQIGAEKSSGSEAIKKAMDVCIEKGVLLDILEKSRNEVFDMLLTEYDEKLHMKTLYEQGKEAGLDEGFGSGYDSANERINTLNEMLKRDNRLDDLFRSFSDKEFQKRLLEEYKL